MNKKENPFDCWVNFRAHRSVRDKAHKNWGKAIVSKRLRLLLEYLAENRPE